jgi:LysM repeat protein
MARAQFKLLLFLIVVGLFIGVLATGWSIYQNILLREQMVERDLAAMKTRERPRIDPGARRFDAAIDLIRGGSIAEGRDALYKLLQQFPDSGTCAEARRIIGEINMDQLFSPTYPAGKKEYIVQPGDSLNLIAQKNQTNVDFILRLNGMMSTTLQPGDRLTVAPIQFNIGVSVGKRQVILFRQVNGKDYPFKFYTAREIVLPGSIRPPAAFEVGVKSAQFGGKTVLATEPHYHEADKWVPAHRPKAVNVAFAFRVPPVAKAVAVVESGAPPAQNEAAASAEDPEAPTGPETGIFLAREDLEELFALVRKGSKVDVAR